jgi:hypothetical protein
MCWVGLSTDPLGSVLGAYWQPNWRLSVVSFSSNRPTRGGREPNWTELKFEGLADKRLRFTDNLNLTSLRTEECCLKQLSDKSHYPKRIQEAYKTNIYYKTGTVILFASDIFILLHKLWLQISSNSQKSASVLTWAMQKNQCY